MFEGLFQPTHLLLIFAIVMLMFGPQKLPQLGKGLGEAIRGFREGIRPTGGPVQNVAAQPEHSLPPAQDDPAKAS